MKPNSPNPMESKILPNLPQEEVSQITECYRTIYQNATELDEIRVLERKISSSKIILSRWKQRNLERGSMLRIQRSFIADELFSTTATINTVDVSQCVLSAFSPTEALKAVISLDSSDKTKGNRFFLDIWNEEKVTMTFNLAELNLHEAVYYDDYFGSLSWSSSEDKILYIAEKKARKTAPFYSQKANVEYKSTDKEHLGEQYVYEDDWGEQISPKRHSVIVICDINQREFEIFDDIFEDNISPGQVLWVPNESGVVGIGFLRKPRKMGIVYCSDKPNCIFYLNTETKKYDILSDKEMNVLSPRFSPNGRHLIWLQRPRGGPHLSAMALVKCDWETKNITTVVDIVSSFTVTNNDYKFHGIYCSKLPVRCWTSDSKYVIFSTPQIYCINSFAANVDDRTLWYIGSDDENVSTIVLDVTDSNFAVGEKTSFKQSSTLAAINVLAAIQNTSKIMPVSWNALTRATNVDEINVVKRFPVFDQISGCYALYYGPESEKNNSVPVVLFIHGGPHTSVSNIYSPLFHFLTANGFAVLIVNYRGSLGCGNDYVHALLGNIGSMDVADCYSTLQHSFKKFPWLDDKNVMLFGGSHGGFLVTHLSARYPNDFKCVVTRNPAVNIPTKVFISDIPNFNTVECGFPYEGIANVMTNENLWRTMAERSPMYHVKNVKAPTLLLLGRKDIRIPHLLGLSYYNALKELNVPSKVLMYDDNHSLSTVPVEMDHVINSLIWFKKYMK